jgi:Lon protease-like protein
MPEQLIPLFPLPSGVLLPGALMPLHVFEVRYRAMMRHTLQRPPARRLIAIALLEEGYEPVYESLAAPINPVVCVGRVAEHEALPDGRFNMLLEGRWRGRVVTEEHEGDFRLAKLERLETDIDAFAANSVSLIGDLERAAGLLVARQVIEARLLEWITESSETPDLLIDRLAYYALPQGDAKLRQAVLAELDLGRRIRMLTEGLIRRSASPADDTSGQRKPTAGWPPPTDSN